MGRIEIQLIGDLRTGRKDILIQYHSAPDLDLVEHEEQHWHIVRRLLGQGMVKAEELGQVIVEREGKRETIRFSEEEPVEVAHKRAEKT